MSIVRNVRATYWVARFVFRFVSGRPLTTSRTTDATFLRPATRSLQVDSSLNRWTAMRGAARSAWRFGTLYGALLLFLLPISWAAEKVHSLPWYLSFYFLLSSHLLLLIGGAGAWGARRITKEHGYLLPRLEEKEEGGRVLRLERIPGEKVWRTEKVLPIARSVSVILGHHISDRRADRWVRVPKNYREGGSTEILLPPHFTGADEGMKKRLVSSVGAKLGTSLTASWQTEGSAPRVLLSAPPEPPSRVEYAEVEEWLLRSEEYRPLMGLTGRGEPLLAEMIDDSPHIAVSAGPGAGKSTLAKLVAMQAFRWGWGAVVLDWKQTEAYAWMGGLPGVTYLTNIEKIHDMGVQIAEEVDRRKSEGMAGRAKILVIRDEWNVTADLLQAYWTDLRSTADPEEKKLMPLKSPALRGYAILDFAGREYGFFDFCIAQRFSARIFNGNADIRECFQIKCLARYSAQTQKMLAPDIKPFPRRSNIPGRWTIVTGDTATVVQVPFITNEQARLYSLGGLANPLFPFGTSQPSQRPEVDDTLRDLLGSISTSSGSVHNGVDSSTRGSKLSEMVDSLAHLGISISILRKESTTDPDFPKVVGGTQFKGYTYSTAEVTEWARKRHARMTSEKASK